MFDNKKQIKIDERTGISKIQLEGDCHVIVIKFDDESDVTTIKRCAGRDEAENYLAENFPKVTFMFAQRFDDEIMLLENDCSAQAV